MVVHGQRRCENQHVGTLGHDMGEWALKGDGIFVSLARAPFVYSGLHSFPMVVLSFCRRVRHLALRKGLVIDHLYLPTSLACTRSVAPYVRLIFYAYI